MGLKIVAMRTRIRKKRMPSRTTWMWLRPVRRCASMGTYAIGMPARKNDSVIVVG